MWKLGLRPRKFFSRNICFEFSVFCLCSIQKQLSHWFVLLFNFFPKIINILYPFLWFYLFGPEPEVLVLKMGMVRDGTSRTQLHSGHQLHAAAYGVILGKIWGFQWFSLIILDTLVITVHLSTWIPYTVHAEFVFISVPDPDPVDPDL